MKLSKILALVAITLVLSACGGGSSTPPEDSNTTQEPNQTTALDKVKAVIASEAGASISYAELNSIAGVDGAVAGKDYVAALAAGTYADRANPTADEIQAVIDSVNTPVAVNHPPLISGTPTTSVLKETPYSFTPTASDSDDDTLTFSITNKPSWATFDESTGTLSGTPSATDVGISSGILIAVSDDIATAELLAFSIEVKQTNVAPSISGLPNTEVNADVAYSFTPTATDSDGDTLVFSIVHKPSWASFDKNTGTLSGTPTNANVGTTSGIVISVNDGTVMVALAAFDVTVKYVNHAPTIEGTPATAIQADKTYTFTPIGADADSADTLQFSIDHKPNWATFDANTGTLSGTPTNADVGTTSDIVISLSDKKETVALASFNITVKLVNHAPTISGTPMKTINADSAYTFTPTANDSDGDSLVFSISNNKPNWTTFDTATGTLSGIPSNADKGTTTAIVISVSDGTDTVALAAFDLTVTPVNHAPVATAQSITLNEDTPKAFTFDGTDVDGNALTYTVKTQPSHGTISGNTYTPNANYFGSDSFTFVANDKTTDSAEATVSITVNAVNDAPVATAQSITLNEDTSKVITFTGTDVEGNALTYIVKTQPSHGTISGNTYTPNPDYFGSDSFNFVANDGSLDSAEATVSITVNGVNDAPNITGTPIRSIDAGESYSFIPKVSDIDSNSFTFSISNNKPNWLHFSTTTGELSGTPSNPDVNTTTGIVITVNDGNDSVALTPFEIEVKFHIENCIDTNGDQGYAEAAEIASGKSISKKTDPASIRLWHTSDGKRKVCVVSGDVTLK